MCACRATTLISAQPLQPFNSFEAELVPKPLHESVSEELRTQNAKYKVAEKTNTFSKEQNKPKQNKEEKKPTMPLPNVTVTIWNAMSLSLPTLALHHRCVLVLTLGQAGGRLCCCACVRFVSVSHNGLMPFVSTDNEWCFAGFSCCCSPVCIEH